MKIEKLNPEIYVYEIKPSHEDAEYTECLWARFTFDCDAGSLTITSDAGDYSYLWGYNEHEHFMHLMSRINKSYLLNKIASMDVFNLQESKRKTIENIEFNGYECYGIKSDEEWKEIKEQINDIMWVSEEGFYERISSIVPDIDVEEIYAEKEYPHGAVILANWFEEYLKPNIKKEYGD